MLHISLLLVVVKCVVLECIYSVKILDMLCPLVRSGKAKQCPYYSICVPSKLFFLLDPSPHQHLMPCLVKLSLK